MIRLARDVRLIPIVLLATVCLLALKVSGIVFDGGYTLAERMESHHKPKLEIADPSSIPDFPKIVDARGDRDAAAAGSPNPWAREMFGYNDSRDVTGSVSAAPKAGKESDGPLKVTAKPPEGTKLQAAGMQIAITPGKINSAGERAILESLHERREQLDARRRELDMRESLLKAAEKRVEDKVAELKEVEGRVKTAMGSRDAAEAKRFKGIIAMYESMKPKDAARIFDRLDMQILVDVSTQMNPRAMSAILAQMTPEAAERLTVELANRASARPAKPKPDELPKIEGRPSGG
jgi:flagellar motility protein MotE (MotC chaperone)